MRKFIHELKVGEKFSVVFGEEDAISSSRNINKLYFHVTDLNNNAIKLTNINGKSCEFFLKDVYTDCVTMTDEEWFQVQVEA